MPSDYDPRALGAKCDICPLKDVHAPVPARGPKGARILLIGEAPGKQEIKQGKAFVGDSGRMLPDLLAEAYRLLPPGIPKIRMSDLRIVNTLEHKPPGGDIMAYLSDLKAQNALAKRLYNQRLKELRSKLGLTAKELKSMIVEKDPRVLDPPIQIPSPVDCCWPRVRREIEGRAVIIPVGALALSVLDPKRNKILRWRGSPFKLDPAILSAHETKGSDDVLRPGSVSISDEVRGVQGDRDVRPWDGKVGSGPTVGVVLPLFNLDSDESRQPLETDRGDTGVPSF